MGKELITVSAFQIRHENEDQEHAIIGLSNGKDLKTGGIFRVRWTGDRSVDIAFDAGEVLQVAVSEIRDNPEVYGVVPGQKRFFWTGTAEVEDS